ncbi:MAG: maleylpyruvate isomerase N-terminal domain-containing protein, partial [Vicinamibacteria bacterium]
MAEAGAGGAGIEPLGPIDAAPLIEVVERHLLDLLRGLRPEDWDKPTAVSGWTVRDVVCHLLDTELRKLSLARDRHALERPNIRSKEDLVAFVNGMNAAGVAFYRRLSPPLLISLMEIASAESSRYHRHLDPLASAAFPVSWA